MKAVLFDLDGTLLDIDMNRFLPRYFGALGPVIAEIAGVSPSVGLEAVLGGTRAMFRPHPGVTNQEIFAAEFAQELGVDVGPDGWRRIDGFYAEVFPTLREGLGPHAGAREALASAKDRGMKVAIATNPIFPLRAIEERLRWADLDDLDFDLVTSYETMHACKPLPEYFTETAQMLGVRPDECLMAGDDVVLDMPAGDIGMRTYLVSGHSLADADDGPSDHSGTLVGLARLLTGLA